MKKKVYALNLRLFDAAAAAPAGDSTGTGAGETIPSLAKKGKANPLADVVYGKQEESPEPDDVPSEPTNADEPQPAIEGQKSDTPKELTLEEKKAEFERLITGDYKDLYTEKFQETFNNRFKDYKTLEGKTKSLDPAIELLCQKYGVDRNDTEALVKAIQNDNDLYTAEAEEKGMTVDQLKVIKKLERENADFRKLQEEQERQQKVNQIQQQWMQQSEEMKKTYPTFDFSKEMQNKDFSKLLASGVGVEAAFKAIHMDELMSGAMQKTADAVAQATVNNIKARSARPSENGITAQPGIVVKNDVSKLTAADRREIARRAARGEQINF